MEAAGNDNGAGEAAHTRWEEDYATLHEAGYTTEQLQQWKQYYASHGYSTGQLQQREDFQDSLAPKRDEACGGSIGGADGG
jgi:hypothetical protein